MTGATHDPPAAPPLLLGLLVLLAWVGLAAGSRQWALVVPLLGVVLARPLLGRLVAFRLKVVTGAILALPVGIHYQLREIDAPAGTQAQNSFHFGLYWLLVAALALYEPPSRRRGALVLFASAAALSAAGIQMPTWLGGMDVWVERWPLPGWPPAPRVLYGGLSAAYGCVALLTLRAMLPTARPSAAAGPAAAAAYRPTAGRTGAIALSFALVLGLTAGLVVAVDAIYDDLSSLYLRATRDLRLRTGAGFSDRAQLGSVEGTRHAASREIALRAYGPSAPGYLRGRAFLEYAGGSWGARSSTERTAVAEGRVFLPGRPPPAPDAEAALSVHPTTRYNANYFLPLEATSVETDTAEVVIYNDGALRSLDRPTTRGYRVHLDATTPLHALADEPPYRQLPDDPALLAALDAVVARLDLPADPPPARVAGALARYFEERYTYRFGIELDPDRDPVLQFLTEKDHGHCELFASAGVLVLRRLGLAARYVTGFVCVEQSEYEDDVWVARNEHAHAWVEAHDPDRGWTLVELTPSSGQPVANPPAGTEGFVEWLQTLWERLTTTLREGAAALPRLLLGALSGAVLWVAGAWWRLTLLGLLIGAAVARALWRRRAPAARALALRSLPPELAAERERYLDLERALRRADLGREGWETLHEYARRLEQAAAYPAERDRQADLALVRAFGARRYAPAS